MPFYVLLADGGLIFQTAFCRIGSDRFDLEWLLPQWVWLAKSVYVPRCTSCLLRKGRLKVRFRFQTASLYFLLFNQT